MKLQDTFDFTAYQLALGKVQVEILKREINVINTVKVPLHRNVHAMHIRDALTETFAHTNVIIRLCVGDNQ